MLIPRRKAAAPSAELSTPSPQPLARRMLTGGLKKPSPGDILAKSSARRVLPAVANSAEARHAKAEEARAEIDTQLKLIAAAENAIDDAMADIEAARKAIESKLRDNNLTSHSNGLYFAELVEQFTRQSRTIDPKKFRNAVANDVFWESIAVNIGKAEQHLTEKELTAISDVIPSRSSGIVLKVKKREPVKRKKG